MTKKVPCSLSRHAKSSWKDTSLIDRQRPLNKRGHRNAADMAQLIAGLETMPEQLVTSPAKTSLHHRAGFRQ